MYPKHKKHVVKAGKTLYSEVPNKRADQNKQAGLENIATLLAYLLSKLIDQQGGIFHCTK